MISESRLLFRSLTASCLVLATGLFARAETPATQVVYVSNHGNSRILRVDFDSNTTTVINTDANKLKNLSALLVRNDGGDHVSLIVCDTGAGKVLFYGDVTSPGFDGQGQEITSKVPLPDGISSDASGNLYLISSGPGGGSGKQSQVWTIKKGGPRPGDYQEATLIDGNVAAELLEDSEVVRTTSGSLQAGDLLVLWRKPARVTRYRPNGSGGYTVANFISSFPPGVEPSGLAFASDLLVATTGGEVLRYNTSGVKNPVNFVSGLGNGPFKIVVGFQDDANRAFVTQRNGHSVFAIDINADGTGTVADSESRGLTFPQGVGIGNANGAYLPAAASVAAAFESQDTTFHGVSKAGLADVTCRLLPKPDPRELASCGPGNCSGECQDDGFCKRPLLLGELDPSLPYGGSVTIPDHVRALRVGHPLTGTPKFFFCEGKTSAQFTFAENQVHEDQFLNWPGPKKEPDCDEPLTSNRAMFFWTPIPPAEPRIFEGTPTSSTFINLATGCTPDSSNRGDIDDYSILLPAAREMLPLCVVADDGLEGIQGALGMPELAPFIPGTPASGLEEALLAKQAAAAGAFKRYRNGNPAAQAVAMNMLDDSTPTTPATTNSFVGLVLANLSAIDNDAAHRNVSGELIVRARSARYIISQVTLPVPDQCLP